MASILSGDYSQYELASDDIGSRRAGAAFRICESGDEHPQHRIRALRLLRFQYWCLGITYRSGAAGIV
jgi:hypothetical protein